MIKEKENALKDKLKLIVEEISHINNIKQEIGKEFVSKNLSPYRATAIFTNPDYLYTLESNDDDIRLLFIFSLALNKATNEEKIKLKDYFTEIEYLQWINFKAADKPKSIYPLVFEDFQQLGDRIWQGTISAQRLAKFEANNLLLYNFMTQRMPKITMSGIKIDFDKTKVQEIKENMLLGKQYPDHLKFNVLRNYQEKIHYNSNAKTLTIGEGSVINIFDGQHRKVANSLVIEENPNIDFTWGLIITNLTENEARDYMSQVNKQKPFRQEQVKLLEYDKKENLVVSVIADDRISKLAKVMRSQESEVRIGRGLTTKNIVAEAIAENYALDETTDIREIGNWIVEFTDYLMFLYPDKFITNPYANRETMINHKNMFYGYIALSAKLKGEDNWRQITKDKMISIDFNNNSQLWKDIGIFRRNMNKISRRKLYSLFMKGVEYSVV